MAYPGQKPEVAKAKQVQSFSAESVREWKEILCKTPGDCKDVSASMERMLHAKTVEEQLKCMRQIGEAMKECAADQQEPPGGIGACMGILVAMHSLCMSRHPLQRALTKLLTSLSWKETLKTSVAARLTEMLHVEPVEAVHLSDRPAQSLLFSLTSYLEALMENFPLGAECLQEKLVEVIHCIVCWLPKLTASSRESSSGTSLAVCCKTFLAVVSRYVEPLRVYSVKGSDPEWVESEIGRVTPVTPEMIAEYEVDVTLTGSETLRADRDQALVDGVSAAGALRLAQDLQSAVNAVWSILADSKCSSLPDVATTCGMLYAVLLRITHQTDSSLGKTCHQALEAEGEAVDYPSVALLPEISRLSLLQGLLSKLPHCVLLMVEEGKEEGRGVCLHHKVLASVCDLFDRASTAASRYVGSRAVAQWTRVTRDMCRSGLFAESRILWGTVADDGSIVGRLLDYVWSYWDDQIEGIPYQMRDIFTNTLIIHQTLHSDADSHSTFVHSLAERVLSVDPFLKPKYTYSGILADHVSVMTMLLVRPHLPLEIMDAMGYQSLAPHAGALWVKLVVQHKAESEADQWLTTWLDPMLHTLHSGSGLQRSLVAQHCVNSPNLPEGSLEYALKELPLHHTDQPSGTGEACLAAQLVCLRALWSRLGDGGGQQGEESRCVLRDALRSSNEEVKVAAFGMLCERRRTTDAPTVADLSAIISFLPDNMSSQSPLFRQQIQACLKQLFRRVIDSSLALSKTSTLGQDPPTIVASMKEFMTAFVALQFSCLNPVVSFQRRTFALHNLETLSRVTGLVKSDKSRSIAESDLVFDLTVYLKSSPCARRVLLQALQDSFEANKEIALQLLLELPVDVDLFESLQAHTEWCFGMSCSPKSVDCTTAAYNWRLLTARGCEGVSTLLEEQNADLRCHLRDILRKEEKDWREEVRDGKNGSGEEDRTEGDEERWRRNMENRELKLQSRECSPGGSGSAVMETLLLLVDTLSLHRAAAGCSLTAASLHAPMYGVIEAIAAILSSSRRPSLADTELAALYEKLVPECLTIADLCLPVVCNSSPEGFLPSSGQGDRWDEGHGTAEGTPTAQSLLLCCWHTMKEISLLFGAMAERASLQELSPTGRGSLSAQQFCQIGTFFTRLLSQARHRGAFEMAFSGFKQFCCRLWLLPPHPSLLLNCHTPSQWLESGLHSLQTTSTGNITRRSAGLPFYFLAILCSAPASETHSHLSRVMEGLMEAVSSTKLSYHSEDRERGGEGRDGPVTQDCTSAALTLAPPPLLCPNELVPEPAGVHALNILRALVRDAQLADSIAPFLGRVYILSVNGFSSEHWAIRNSSTMLFSSLINRMFGVKRVRDEHQKQNKMSSKKLFTQFPMLRGYLQKKLQDAVDRMEQVSVEEKEPTPMDPLVFPVLLTLSRLFPSPLDDKESPTSLEPFKPLVRRFTGSSLWKLRALASQTLATITVPGEIPLSLTQVGHTLPHSPECCTSQNRLHGDILLLKELLHQLLAGAKGAATKIVSECEAVFADLLAASWIGTSKNPCPVTRAGYAEVIQVFVEQLRQPSAGGSGAVVDQMLPFVADLKGDLVKVAVEGGQQGKAVGTQWLLKESLMSQFHLYASMVDHNQGASLEVLTGMLLSQSPAVVEVAVEACAGVLVAEGVLPPHQDFLAVYPPELCKAGEDMQLACLRLSTVLVNHSGKGNPSKLCDHFHSFFKQVLELGQQPHQRHEVQMAVLEFIASWASALESFGSAWSHVESLATLALVSRTCSDDQLEQVRLSSAKVLAAIWWHCLCGWSSQGQSTQGGQTTADQAQLVTAFWKVFIQCLFDSDSVVRETAWLGLLNISQHLTVSEWIVGKEDAPFCRHRHLTTAVELTSDCIAGSFARFPLAGYLFLESQLLEYRTGVLCKEDTRKTSSSALLFEEGPINDYREDMLLCNLWCEALRRLCTLHHSKKDVSSQMSQLCTMCLENLDRIVDRYSLKRASSILPPLFSKEGSFLTLSLYTNLNILHFLRESSNVADNKEPPRQWSTVDLCKDSLAQYCCLPHTSTCFTS